MSWLKLLLGRGPVMRAGDRGPDNLNTHFWIVLKRIKLTRLMKHNFWAWCHCCFLTSEYLSFHQYIIQYFNVYVDGDNVDVYVEIILTIVNGLQPFIINTKRSILDFASVLDPPLNTIERLQYCPFLCNMYI